MCSNQNVWFKTHQRHGIVSLSKTLYPLLSTGSTQEVRKTFWHDWKIVDRDVKHKHKQTNQNGNYDLNSSGFEECFIIVKVCKQSAICHSFWFVELKKRYPLNLLTARKKITECFIFCCSLLQMIFKLLIRLQVTNSFLASGDFNRCKQFEPRSGPTERRSWSGSKLFNTLIVFLNEFFEKVNF